MSTIRTLSCEVCPRGCFLEAEMEDGEVVHVSGNDCARGAKFAALKLNETMEAGTMPKTTTEWKAFLNTEAFLEAVTPLYIASDAVAAQPARYRSAIEAFEERFGEGEAELFSAPGRSEVGGNHTDHQHGKVLACSLNLDVIAVVRKTDDNIMTVKSEGYPEDTVDLSVLEPVPEEEGTSQALLRGVASALKDAGYAIGGFQAYTTSNVLQGSGMSSSAAFEVLLGTILSGLYNEDGISPVDVAKASQVAENRFFGKPSGLLDQMACSVGNLVYIDFGDPSEPQVEQVDADFGAFGHSLCIVDTKGSHADLTPDYAAVPDEMKQIAAFFGQEVLNGIPEEKILSHIPILRERIGDRQVLRAIHWYEENKRVEREVEALTRGDFPAFLSEVKASGDSSYKYLQNVYSARHLEAQAIPIALQLSDLVLQGEGASRVHGGGFAGTIQAFVPNDLVEDYQWALESVFGEGACHILYVRSVGGYHLK